MKKQNERVFLLLTTADHEEGALDPAKIVMIREVEGANSEVCCEGSHKILLTEEDCSELEDRLKEMFGKNLFHRLGEPWSDGNAPRR